MTKGKLIYKSMNFPLFWTLIMRVEAHLKLRLTDNIFRFFCSSLRLSWVFGAQKLVWGFQLVSASVAFSPSYKLWFTPSKSLHSHPLKSFSHPYEFLTSITQPNPSHKTDFLRIYDLTFIRIALFVIKKHNIVSQKKRKIN